MVKSLLTEHNAWDAVILDEHPFRVGQINKLVKDNHRGWKRKLSATLKCPNVGGVLLLLDGDTKRVGNAPFCAANTAKYLAATAVNVGGGSKFQVAKCLCQVVIPIIDYKQTRDQATQTQWLDLQVVRARGIHSFQRLESAVSELVTTMRGGNRVITPSEPREKQLT